jgi:hypothetical protein
MRFIEDLFGISPDGGSGSLELVLFVAPLLLLGAFYAWQARRHGIH